MLKNIGGRLVGLVTQNSLWTVLFRQCSCMPTGRMWLRGTRFRYFYAKRSKRVLERVATLCARPPNGCCILNYILRSICFKRYELVTCSGSRDTVFQTNSHISTANWYHFLSSPGAERSWEKPRGRHQKSGCCTPKVWLSYSTR